MNLGKKIAIVGVSAAGKSIFARKLAGRIQLPLTHIDTVMWKPGWEYIGDEETVRQLQELSSRESWIIEGFIEKEAFDAVLGRADAVIYLDYPGYVPAWRYIKRWLKHRKSPRPELKECPETFSLSFFTRVWKRKEVYWLNRFLEEMPESGKVIRLKSPKEAETFLQNI